MTSRLRTAASVVLPVVVPAAVLAGQLLLLSACTGDDPAPTPSATTTTGTGSPTPSASPSETDAAPTPSETGSAPSDAATPAPDEQALFDRVRAEGTLSVIVEVTLDDDADPGTAAHRRLIAAAQDDLVAQLDPAHAQVTTRFQRNPQMTLTVDEDGLRALFDTSRVARVWENETVRLH